MNVMFDDGSVETRDFEIYVIQDGFVPCTD